MSMTRVLRLNDRLGHPVDRFMSCPLGTISKRPRLEVRLEDRLQYELERPLHHPVPDRRNRKDADFAPVLRYLLPPGRQRHDRCARPVRPVICSRKASTPCASMASKVTPSIPGAPSFFLASAYASRRVSILQTWTYRPQKRQDGSAFALTYILRLRSCKSMDAFVISPLPSLIEGDITNSRAPSLHGHYSASSLLRTHPPPSRLRSTSRLSPVIRPTLLRRFRAGTRRASPVARHVLVTVLSLPPRRGEHAASVRFRHAHAAFALRLRARPSGLLIFEATSAFTFVTAR